ncbi:unnamed protein product [Diatraea saccharalis]|uniref:Uncharacterized protein n=1 Tax=Diatraea saccharalis TaxID=40085 RepID=A0A9N9WDT6_9NEOP|nr:unnamed protein product [Diatraea saccharalis]
MLMISAWDAFVFHPISFGVETTYTDWNTEMPTIAICEKESELKVFAFADTYWPPDHSPDLEDALKEIVFFRGSCNALLTNCYTPKSPDPICPLSNYMQTTIEQRACRFYTENQQVFYPFYSYSGCVVECRKKAQMENCQCMDHLMPGATEKERCNITGLACLHSKKAYLTTLKPPWRKTPGLVCNCLPSCNENEITVVKDVHIKMSLKVHMLHAHLDKFKDNLGAYSEEQGERFHQDVMNFEKRYQGQYNENMMVYVGGTAGLFVGASILSFVEFIFFFTIRLGSNFLMDWQKRKSKQSILVKPKTEDIGKSLNVSSLIHSFYDE